MLNSYANGESSPQQFHNPPRTGQGSASRHRRSLGQTVGEVVDHQLARRSISVDDRMKSHPREDRGYHPSFVAQGPRDLEDINDALEQRVRSRRGSGIHIGDLGKPKSSMGKPNRELNHFGFGTPPNQPNRPPVMKNKLPSASVSSNLNRRTSLSLSYGPIISSLDEQAATSRRNRVPNPPTNMGIQGGLGGSFIGGPRKLVQQQSLLQPTTANNEFGKSAELLNGSIERSWRKQVDAATARVAARPSRQMTSKKSHDPGNTGHRAISSAMPNTLTLDNWFTANPDEEGEAVSPTESQSSSRRNSGLAPLPDLDDDEGYEEIHPGLRGRGDSVVELKDVDDQELHQSMMSLKLKPFSMTNSKGKPFSLELATSLRVLVFGATNRVFPSGWIGQSFAFCHNPELRFGLIQNRGGPCGVLAAVQAHVIKAFAFDTTSRAVNPLVPTEKERTRALAVALVNILNRCCQRDGNLIFAIPSAKAHFTGIGRYKNDGITETLIIHEFNNERDAISFAMENVGFFASEGNHAVIAFLYSVLLTRGIANVTNDMDSADLPLMGAHGYCSQEMVNLMLTGRAVSNTFDYTVTLEGNNDQSTFLRGIETQSEIGLLSLFEHYQSCTVGEHLKTPQVPIWLICSESHFSVLFSLQPNDVKTTNAERKPVHLVYYDPLARMEQLYVLSVDCSRQLVQGDQEQDGDLVPPLEHCIRTKWREAVIDWNGHEKIL